MVIEDWKVKASFGLAYMSSSPLVATFHEYFNIRRSIRWHIGSSFST